MNLLIQFAVGFVIAYILNFLMTFYERKISKRRWISLTLTYATVIGILFLFFYFLVPQFANGMEKFIEEFPTHADDIVKKVETSLNMFDLEQETVVEILDRLELLINEFVRITQNIVPHLMQNMMTYASFVKNVVLGIVISVYFLARKETFERQARQVTAALVNKTWERKVIHYVHRAHVIVGRFFLGTLLNSVIVGVITVVLLFVFRIPFAILIGFIMAISNVIPIFGPFIGAVPAVIMIFFVSPAKALWFLVIMLVIQQVEGNIIAPKILGDKIGIGSFWILFATLVFGHFFGLMGMVVGVPIFAIIYEIFKDYIKHRLSKYEAEKSTKPA